MLQIDESSEVYTSGKVTKHPSIEGRYIYHVAADRDDERSGSLVATEDAKTAESQVGERKSIPFKTKNIVSAGEIVISSDESKVVYYQKRFRIQNSSMTGRIQYRKDGQVRDVPANAFVPFEVEPTYNRIGSIAVHEGGRYELRLRGEYRYDWITDNVKFQYVDEDVTYEAVFDNLNSLYSSTGPVILEPVSKTP